MTKEQARRIVKDQKKLLSKELITSNSKKIMKALLGTSEFQQADTILTYVNYNQEVETRQLMEYCLDHGKNLLVPKVYGNMMHFHKLDSLDELQPGAYGIPEPDNDHILDPEEGFMVMPGLAFDRQLHRIGYGGGYYDRYLEARKHIIKAAVCFDFQILNHLDTETYDLKPDIIVTESTIIRENKA